MFRNSHVEICNIIVLNIRVENRSVLCYGSERKTRFAQSTKNTYKRVYLDVFGEEGGRKINVCIVLTGTRPASIHARLCSLSCCFQFETFRFRVCQSFSTTYFLRVFFRKLKTNTRIRVFVLKKLSMGTLLTRYPFYQTA